MTHEELDTIAAAWPEAARKGYQYYTAANVTEDGTDERYWALVGKGLAWLVGEGYMPELYRCAEGRGIRGGVVRETLAEEEHMLAAVHAAVMAVGKEGV